ncbi:unnamed protein product [Linum trigynum]|uniref:Zinc finger GRF-type domain-containing protein n=1 Tax=Linum trigynum TaxID=586398 RepID=A0AAV2EPH8_9ROSI
MAATAPMCRYAVPAVLRTSWTDANPGRRFFGCPNYGVQTHATISVGSIHHLRIMLNALVLHYTRGSKRWSSGTIANHLSEKSSKVLQLWLEFFWQGV